jgi:hypothetical protein
MPEPSLISELQNHTGTLVVLVGTMGVLVGVFAGALGNIVWNRLEKVEKRQEDLRGNVLPQLITKEDLKAVVETLEKVGMAFVERVEDFMSACRKGECAMALFIKNQHHKMKEGS